MSIELQHVRVDLPVYNTNVRSLRKALMKATVGGPLMHGNVGSILIRALNNVSMKIEDGERIGLVGGNGAGKTTLLKVLAGVLAPSEGTVKVSGTVSAALNIALGIDGEISGRENIFLLGYYRGLKRSQIEAEIESIVACADLGNYINLPVNTYSAGMRGRLTFAVATAFSADVLLLDEWLLAGDAAFNERALGRTLDLFQNARIVVLATHNLTVVREHCTKAIFMKAGTIVAIGSPENITAQYEADTHADYLNSLSQNDSILPTARGA